MSKKRTAFRCRGCGRCCETRAIELGYSDIARWRKEKRADVLRHVSWANNYPRKNTGGFYFAGTILAPKRPCPFYLRGRCRIYGTRPLACRDYPCASEPEDCPAYSKGIFTRKREEEAKKGWEEDFRKAFMGQAELYRILVEARR